MRAVCWPGIRDVRIDTVPDPRIEEKGDILIKITRLPSADRTCTSSTVSCLRQIQLPARSGTGHSIDAHDDGCNINVKLHFVSPCLKQNGSVSPRTSS